MSVERLSEKLPSRWLALFAMLSAAAASAWTWAHVNAVRSSPADAYLTIGRTGPHEQVITKGYRPIVSPGGRVYFARDVDWVDASGQVYSCMVDGSSESIVQLVPPVRFACRLGEMSFSQDPPRCYLNYYVLDVGEYFGEGVLEAPDRLRILVRDLPAVRGGWAYVSRDGRLCVHLVKPTGRRSYWALATLGSGGAAGPPLWAPDPVRGPIHFYGDWAPGSGRFAFSNAGGGRKWMVEGYPLDVLDVRRRVLTDEYKIPGASVEAMAWSPDGRWIAFHVDMVEPPDSPMFYAVCVLDLSSGRAWRLSQCVGCPQWSPDMAYLVYERDGFIFRLDWRAALADKAQEVPMKHKRLDVGPQPPAKTGKGARSRDSG